MARAGIFIGCDQTGNLQKLNDAAAGAKRMHAWAIEQGITDGTHAHLIIDEGRKIVPGDIYDLVKAFINGPGIDQLILYFAGHGVNISRNEYWLLTDAPDRTSAAVNVTGSVDLARYSGIPHVVFISDACRVAPEGIQAQNVRGEDVFPNTGISDRARPVDQLFACFLGRTAAEIKDPKDAASNYSALYTTALLEALKGLRPEVLERSTVPREENVRYVRPRKLQSFLEGEIPLRVKSLGLERKVNQNPDAIITSDSSWLSRLDVRSAVRGLEGRRAARRNSGSASPTPVENLNAVSVKLVESATSGDKARLNEQLRIAREAPVAGAAQLAGAAERLAAPFGPDHFESKCGIKVRGSRIVEFFAHRAQGELFGTPGNLLRIDNVDPRGASVLLRFEGDVGALIPVIPGFLAALTFGDEGDLIDVAYEPSANTWRWDMYRDHADEVRALRAVAASSSQHGLFRLNTKDAGQVASKMQYAKGIDPTLAVYAAYAYNDLGATDRIRSMSDYLRADVGATFFDLALLGRTLINKPVGADDAVLPFAPLLSQGWAFLVGHRVRLHPALEGIERMLKDSLWSLYNATGMQVLRRALQSGEVR